MLNQYFLNSSVSSHFLTAYQEVINYYNYYFKWLDYLSQILGSNKFT